MLTSNLRIKDTKCLQRIVSYMGCRHEPKSDQNVKSSPFVSRYSKIWELFSYFVCAFIC